ncbi:Arfip1 protein [Capsaspora owczarzaki ATCC 30864]|uniref:Arfip1 protein n=1 Tax=Capsaspora owczarzaki (strain ATCC 30864) TaxID=595528 RepID=A0A0D2VQ78_CAPO3|nr:Arfip1 protein [Capsaspora owczarzaki ATCC 30864]KJE92752.1 Arfip1 protein [Capsaspora owczarzaki ATCC 30864]|eukprot:XP_004363388.1 Arfip1 protein [Capsaspora owczarzaki ATCC 30864]
MSSSSSSEMPVDNANAIPADSDAAVSDAPVTAASITAPDANAQAKAADLAGSSSSSSATSSSPSQHAPARPPPPYTQHAQHQPSAAATTQTGQQQQQQQQRGGADPASSSLPVQHHQSAAARGTLMDWGYETYAFTRQFLTEKLGGGSYTVDIELQRKIDTMRDNHTQCKRLLQLAESYVNNFTTLVGTQHQLGSLFAEAAIKTPALATEFSFNHATQVALQKNGRVLLAALRFFASNLHTLCNKTMEDTFDTLKEFENARINYDAFRIDLERMQASGKGLTKSAQDARERFDAAKGKFDAVRIQLNIKMRLLDENRVKVLQKQLLLFHNAISAYFSGNQEALASTMHQFLVPAPEPSAFLAGENPLHNLPQLPVLDNQPPITLPSTSSSQPTSAGDDASGNSTASAVP